MTLHEANVLSELSHAPTLETSGLPFSKLSLLVEHFMALNKNGEVAFTIWTPEEITSGSEVRIFIAPAGDKTILPLGSALDKFMNSVTANLLFPPLEKQNARSTYSGDQDVEPNLRNFIEDGSLCVPMLVYEDEISAQVETAFTKREPQTQINPITIRLGLASNYKEPEELYRRIESRDKIKTILYFYPTARYLWVSVQSLETLYKNRGIRFGHNNIFTVFGDLVSRCIQKRHAQQIRNGSFIVSSPVNYLRSLRIPLTQDEADTFFE